MAWTSPWSVLAASFLVSLGLVVCAGVTLPPVWILLVALGRDPWPPPSWGLVLATVTVVLVTMFTTLCAFFYNLIARCVGGVELTLAEGVPDPTGPAPTAAGPTPGASGGPPPDRTAEGPTTDATAEVPTSAPTTGDPAATDPTAGGPAVGAPSGP
ncbi:DUF3566 domain-containing protein [Streptomyces sp. NPDC015220]|uniref:DUF3566 domain-containing protein n=1 Tax=Streptomyces sp. NPDC015220 TaxID=3364947 RepID=UPI003702D1BE